MFIIAMTYKIALTVIDSHLAEHRQFLDQGYEKDIFLVSGPRSPRAGGIIISLLSDEAELRQIMQEDPFVINNLVDFEIIPFEPTRYHPTLTKILHPERV